MLPAAQYETGENLFETDARYREPWLAQWAEQAARPVLRCARCLYDENTPAIIFDENGVCNYCQMADDLDREYPAGQEGERILESLAEKIRRAGRRKKYDVVVGVSGGCDSSCLVIKAKELGLRPLAAHFDNTWNSTIAVQNIHSVLEKLNVDLFTYVVDNAEYRDIQRAFLRAGVPDLESPTDLGLASTLYMAASKYGVKYIFEGHSFRTEGVSPLGWLYMDAKYVRSVHRQYGERKMKTYPSMWFRRQMKWRLLNRIKFIRPLYYINHNKEAAKRMLSEQYGWQWYGGHHLENRITNFYHTYFMPRRFGIDQRLNGFSALVRSGQMSRQEGLDGISRPPDVDFELVDLVKKRLGLDDETFERLMTQPIRTWREFKTYKPMFERLRPMFWVMYKMDLLPKSFYIKYTSKDNV